MAWTLHRGDALTKLTTIADASIDLVLADPPYNSGGRTNSERRSHTARCKYTTSDAKRQLPDFPGDNRDQRSYTYWLTLILAECHRASRLGTSALIFTDWRQLPATSDALQAAGWTWRGVIPWYKPNNRPAKNGFRRACEYIVWGSNGAPFEHTPTIYLPGLVTASQPGGKTREHITQKPVSVLQELVRICPPGGTVLDPFAGSGSAGVAALLEGREYIGLELTSAYAEVARRRLAEVQDDVTHGKPKCDRPVQRRRR